MNKLGKYLEKKNIKPQEFAQEIDVCRYTVDRYIDGSRKPKDHIKEKIFYVTGGEITPNDWFDLPAPNMAYSQNIRNN